MEKLKALEFKNYIVLSADIETIIYNGQHVPVAVGFYTGAFVSTFSIARYYTEADNNLILASTNMMKDFITYLPKAANYYNRVFIYFHNMANFDGYFLMQILQQQTNYNTKIFTRENKIYEIKFEIDKITFVIRDSLLLIPFSLREAAIIFNKEHFKFEFQHTDLTLDNLLEKLPSLLIYLKQDVTVLQVLLHNYYNKILQTFGVNIFDNLTIYSLGQKLFYKRKEVKDGLKYIPLTNNLKDVIRKSFFGGIVDIYKPYGKNLAELDINSMYPSVMRDLKIGWGRPRFVHNITDIEHFLANNVGFVQAKIQYLEPVYLPLLCMKHDETNVQPVGEFVGYFWINEVKWTLDTYRDKVKIFINKGIIYDHTDYIFRDFIDEFIDYRIAAQNNNDKFEKIIKLMLNSLYGRFGIKPGLTSKVILSSAETEKFFANTQASIVYMREINEDAFYIDYIINDKDATNFATKNLRARIDWASAITAEARLKIHKFKILANIYYSDTDSLFIPTSDLNKIYYELDQLKLGKLKLEADWDECVFISTKVYACRKTINDTVHYKIRISGLQREFINKTDEDIYNLFIAKLYDDDVKISGEIKEFFKLYAKTFEIKEKNPREIVLTLSFNKRQKIYKDNKWVDTTPLVAHINDEFKSVIK